MFGVIHTNCWRKCAKIEKRIVDEGDALVDKLKRTETNRKQHLSETWFWKYVIDNKFVSTVIIFLLLFITIYVFLQISHIFSWVGQILSIIGPPIVFAMIFYYLLKPIVDQLERRGMSRKLAIWLVFLGILFILALLITFLIPGIREQFTTLIVEFPSYWNSALAQLEEFFYTDWITQLYQEAQATNLIERVTQQLTNVFSVTIDSLGSFFGSLTRVVVTIFTMPFVLYYFLADSNRFKQGIINITPTRARPTLNKFMFQASDQIGAYVRGELLVAVAVSIMFYIGYRIIHLDYALLLAIAAGVLNLIPYLGSILASVPAMIIGAFISPWKFIQVLLVLAVEQLIEGRVVSPQILGNRLDLHPLVILFILLIAGSLFGFMGLILAVPGFGILRVLWNLFFEWLRNSYDYYDEIVVEEVVKEERVEE